jgi:hypothetical protein
MCLTINNRLEALNEGEGIVLLSEYTTTSGSLAWWPTFADVNSSSSCSKEPTSED